MEGSEKGKKEKRENRYKESERKIYSTWHLIEERNQQTKKSTKKSTNNEKKKKERKERNEKNQQRKKRMNNEMELKKNSNWRCFPFSTISLFIHLLFSNTDNHFIYYFLYHQFFLSFFYYSLCQSFFLLFFWFKSLILGVGANSSKK